MLTGSCQLVCCKGQDRSHLILLVSVLGFQGFMPWMEMNGLTVFGQEVPSNNRLISDKPALLSTSGWAKWSGINRLYSNWHYFCRQAMNKEQGFQFNVRKNEPFAYAKTWTGSCDPNAHGHLLWRERNDGFPPVGRRDRLWKTDWSDTWTRS